jgi:hypothetical protein
VLVVLPPRAAIQDRERSPILCDYAAERDHSRRASAHSSISVSHKEAQNSGAKIATGRGARADDDPVPGGAGF